MNARAVWVKCQGSLALRPSFNGRALGELLAPIGTEIRSEGVAEGVTPVYWLFKASCHVRMLKTKQKSLIRIIHLASASPNFMAHKIFLWSLRLNSGNSFRMGE